LLEEHGFINIAESTLQCYIKGLQEWEVSQITKGVYSREYEAIPDSPMGEQIQIDLGEIWVPTPKGIKVRVRIVTFVLSHSRYKYME